MKRGWFGPKVYGWGASPASWEGWLATMIFLFVLVGTLTYFQGSLIGWLSALAVFAAFLILVNRTYDPKAGKPF